MRPSLRPQVDDHLCDPALCLDRRPVLICLWTFYAFDQSLSMCNRSINDVFPRFLREPLQRIEKGDGSHARTNTTAYRAFCEFFDARLQIHLFSPKRKAPGLRPRLLKAEPLPSGHANRACRRVPGNSAVGNGLHVINQVLAVLSRASTASWKIATAASRCLGKDRVGIRHRHATNVSSAPRG